MSRNLESVNHLMKVIHLKNFWNTSKRTYITITIGTKTTPIKKCTVKMMHLTYRWKSPIQKFTQIVEKSLRIRGLKWVYLMKSTEKLVDLNLRQITCHVMIGN